MPASAPASVEPAADASFDKITHIDAVSTPAPETPQTLVRRRRIVLGGIGLAILVAVAIWGGRWWSVGRFIESTDDAYLQADSVTAAPKVGGYVVQVYVRDNETVAAGQPLVRLDSRPYQAAFDKAEATIAVRRADVVRSQAELIQQQANIARAKAEVDGASANVEYTASQVRRYAPLARSGAETEERIAELRNAYARAVTTLAADKAAWHAAESQTNTLQAALAQARAQLAVTEASARQARLDLDDTIVRSTMAGRVADRSVRVGQYAQPGTRFLTVVPVRNLYLLANFKETQIGRMRAGQPVIIHVDALPGEDLHGTVDSLSPGTGSQFALLPAQNATGNFTKIVQRVPVRILLDQRDMPRGAGAILMPGLSVTADVDTRAISAERARDATGGAHG